MLKIIMVYWSVKLRAKAWGIKWSWARGCLESLCPLEQFRMFNISCHRHRLECLAHLPVSTLGLCLMACTRGAGKEKQCSRHTSHHWLPCLQPCHLELRAFSRNLPYSWFDNAVVVEPISHADALEFCGRFFRLSWALSSTPLSFLCLKSLWYTSLFF